MSKGDIGPNKEHTLLTEMCCHTLSDGAEHLNASEFFIQKVNII